MVTLFVPTWHALLWGGWYNSTQMCVFLWETVVETKEVAETSSHKELGAFEGREGGLGRYKVGHVSTHTITCMRAQGTIIIIQMCYNLL